MSFANRLKLCYILFVSTHPTFALLLISFILNGGKKYLIFNLGVPTTKIGKLIIAIVLGGIEGGRVECVSRGVVLFFVGVDYFIC